MQLFFPLASLKNDWTRIDPNKYPLNFSSQFLIFKIHLQFVRSPFPTVGVSMKNISSDGGIYQNLHQPAKLLEMYS